MGKIGRKRNYDLRNENSEIILILGENHSSKSGSHLFLWLNGIKRCR